jgi:xylan 1,4-beta-xylosidase
MSVLAWNYHDDDVAGADANVRIDITGIPSGHVLLREYRIDQTHSNAWTVWKKMGSPQHPSAEQYTALEAAGQLEQFGSPRWIVVKNGETTIDVTLPRQGVSLLNLLF